MPTITVSIGGFGRTKTISAGDLSTRLMPALRYFNPDMIAVTHPAGTEEATVTPTIDQGATDAAIIERWADKVIAELLSSVEVLSFAFRSRLYRGWTI
jgi:hypothetical protein